MSPELCVKRDAIRHALILLEQWEAYDTNNTPLPAMVENHSLDAMKDTENPFFEPRA